MRKLSAVLAACLLLVTLAGCGDGEEDTSSMGTLAESALSQLESAASELEVMTVEETMDFFNRLSPSVLGLDAETMDQYDMYYNMANVPVDGVPCLEITVYGETETAQTNTPLGTYLVARDGTALYHLDVDTDTVTRLDF